jgi:hypothetical protein
MRDFIFKLRCLWTLIVWAFFEWKKEVWSVELNSTYRWLYVKYMRRCPYDKALMYDPSVADNSKIRECTQCGRMWIL